jgi:hypothetical protein
LQLRHHSKHTLLALTIIGPATGWFEIARTNNKSASFWFAPAILITEQVHKVVNKMLRSFELEKLNLENLEEDNPFDYFFQSNAWAIRSTYHTTLQATPCQLVFGRDMIQNIAFKAN